MAGGGTFYQAKQGAGPVIHPLLHEDTSDLSERRFSSTFTGEEFFLKDHVLQGRRVLPGAAYLEMARAALLRAALPGTHGPIRLRNVAWVQPLIVTDVPADVHIRLFPDENGDIVYEVYSTRGAGAEPLLHGQGRSVQGRAAKPESIDIEKLRRQCDQGTLSPDQVYETFRAMEIEYGPAHRGIEIIHLGRNQVLAKLTLPPCVSGSEDQFILHPGIMDAAIQASLGLLMEDGYVESKTIVPFALDELEIFGGCVADMWAVIRYSHAGIPGEKTSRFDIDLCDERGQVFIRMRGLSTRVLGGAYSTVERPVTTGTLVLERPREDGRPFSGVEPPDGRATDPEVADLESLQDKAINYFTSLLSSVSGVPADSIEAEAPLDTFGIDSVMVVKTTGQLEKTFGPLPITLFFEYQNIRELAGYFLEFHQDRLGELLASRRSEQPTVQAEVVANVATDPVRPLSFGRVPFAPCRDDKEAQESDIAVIGVAGRYPQAENIREFWQNLRDGRDCITEIPKDRWDYDLYFDGDKNKPGKTYSKWGGFLEGVDQFDPLFFNISPHEAEIMDPQERLFLECVFHVMEDAGYTRERLGSYRSLEGNVGVYVGVMYQEYQLYGAQEQVLGRAVALGGISSTIANRVSYYFNFHGPSMAVDTMCSSSLTAIHLACQSLQRRGCGMAIAGGVNVSVHPNKYLMLAQGKFISSSGRCESFGQGGDGYVPGEGVGAVLLKPLRRAITDGDHIYGIIRGTAVNHGGKTSGFTVPNPKAQAGVIAEAFREAGIDPRSISYIEAHGTGTSLGDPVEIAGLSKVFETFTQEKQYCAIGSVKSNIGHCESASGIAGVTKVLLQLEHGQLVPSIHSQVLNPKIDFSKTPFTVQHDLAEWKRPLFEGRAIPRRAGVSSFGAGGSNAHVVIEEYLPGDEGRREITVTARKPAVIVLSARNEERLRELAGRLLAAVEEGRFSDADLPGIAYTLQVGREGMEERLALIVDSVDQLKEKLKRAFGGPEGVDGIYRGQAKRNKDALAVLSADEDMAQIVDTWIAKGKHGKLADLWVKGLVLDWNRLYGDVKPGRISLPGYPFARERYWLPEAADKLVGKETRPGVIPVLHPLLHENTSTLSEQRFSSTFTGEEFFLRDHVVQGRRVLPAAAYLEMARAAAVQAVGVENDGQGRIQLRNVVWARPVIVGDHAVRVRIGIFPQDNGEVIYEIYGDSAGADSDQVVYSQGIVTVRLGTKEARWDLSAIEAECDRAVLSCDQCYEALAEMGIEYGPGQRGIETLYLGHSLVLASLAIPPSVTDTKDQFVLHPSLLDAALQASLGLNWSVGKALPKPLLPFALDEVEILGGHSSRMWAVVRYSHGSQAGDRLKKVDIDLCDGRGEVCVRLKGLTFRDLEGQAGLAESPPGTVMFQGYWRQQGVFAQGPVPDYAGHVVMLCEPGEVDQSSIETRLDGVRCLVLQSDREGIDERFSAYAARAFEEIQDILRRKPKGKVLIQVVASTENEQEMMSGLSGLLKTAELENPQLVGQMIQMERETDAARISALLIENSHSPLDKEIRYQGGRRLVAGWSELAVSLQNVPWKNRGVYLITGGAGGLGLIFAREIAGRVREPVLILTGRSVPAEGRQLSLRELAAMGARVEYRQVDVTDRVAVTGLVQGIQKQFGGLDGIIHCAGVIRDDFIFRKTTEEFLEVLAPKVRGVVNLDQASRDQGLEFFILFSSLAGSLGNPGQADYAAANAFLDAYARHRNGLVEGRKRRGRTYSISWPLWKDGGMRVDEEMETRMRETTGLTAMGTVSGIKAFYEALASGQDRVMVMEGDLPRLRTRLFGNSSPVGPLAVPSDSMGSPDQVITQDGLQAKAVNYFKKLLSSVIKLPSHSIQADAPMEKYGIDSVMIMKMTDQLESTFGSLPKTLFFEHQDIQSLTGYFLEFYGDQLTKSLGTGNGIQASSHAVPIAAGTAKPLPVNMRRPRFAIAGGGTNEDRKPGLDIAIVGLAGRYPQSRDVHEFWANLRDGKDCITEIPKERWDHDSYYDQDKNKQGKTYSKWGGFLEGVDRFDPLLFNITPREAEMMDPQERLFLECVFETLEDAGYGRVAPGPYRASGLEGDVGVYVGVMYEEYQLYGAQEQVLGRPVALGGSPSTIANRVSYYFNFHGPSMAVDTMCSSSLTAIHLACHSLQRGECEIAIAGGVNVSIHPNKYLILAQNRFVSSKGRCESFGRGGDGYVPGEGVGAVLLKPLSRAIADGDHIYAIIKGTAINHGGKTNGYTVPNPNAQAAVIARALKEAGISPRAISYVEAHGTGTSLGDPIEIAGLSKTFGENTKERQFCAIGSAKSNIGHCESAAGIAGVTKVLLQLKHRQLVPSLHSRELNPNIDFSNSPFVVQQELAQWDRPLVDGREVPRCAGVSSFGAGGSNAHVVIEEYLPPDKGLNSITVTTGNPVVVVLSAKSEDRLKEQVKRLLTVIDEQRLSDTDLPDLAYTLQVGRGAMEERLALIVGSIDRLKERLQMFLAGTGAIDGLYRGQAGPSEDTLAIFSEDEDMAQTIDAWVLKGKHEKIVGLWVKGLHFDWNRLYSDLKPRRISLPTYPFARERYWLPRTMDQADARTRKVIHPLLQENTSDFAELRFSSTFTGEEFFLRDRVVAGRRVLAETACLEMARAAVHQAAGISQGGQTGIRLQDIVWAGPIAVDEQPVRVDIGLFPGDHGEIAYEIRSSSGVPGLDPLVHCQGRAKFSRLDHLPSLDLPALQSRCFQGPLSSDEFYRIFAAAGVEYGPGYRGLETVLLGRNQVLARISLPFSLPGSADQFVLHPALLESALQAAAGLATGAGDQGSTISEPVTPVSMKEVEIAGKLSPAMWAWVRHSQDNTATDGSPELDIDLCDEQGQVAVRVRGLDFKSIEKGENGFPECSESGSMGTEDLTAASVEYLKLLVAEETKTPVGQVNPQVGFGDLGLNSIMIARFDEIMEKRFGKSDVTLFFRYNTIQSLGAYFAKTYPDKVAALTQKATGSLPARPPALPSLRASGGSWREVAASSDEPDSSNGIAVIGVAGRYPQSADLDQFWRNLYEGRDCIQEIPPGRWPLDGFYEPDRVRAVAEGLSYSKWGGFLEDFDRFDPLFFNISPRDALFMDPQERLFLETAWECLEDAGYTRESIRSDGNRVGVFVGATFNNYQLCMAEAALRDGRSMYPANSQIFSIANRVSFVMNFTGPSLTVDTACSSSLYALHLACEGILGGRCGLALAGGVNLSLHPSKYVTISQSLFNADDGRCHAFGEGGTGYGPSEGVGAVLLKPLAAAVRDKDIIYGIIKGTAVSHAGKTGGYTVPSPVAQTEVIEEALRRGRIHPRTVTCIEAHGTGTALGDPFEVSGLTEAFRKYTQETGFCSISSVKSNIGHSEAAAGIAQLTKVLLQFKHRTLVKNLMHGRGVNPHIDFAATPFVLQENTEYWRPAAIDGREVPRRAGISSLGAGGSCAHIVVQEYAVSGGEQTAGQSTAACPVLIVLSARKEDGLQEMARRLLTAIEEGRLSDDRLVDVAYTLQTGREAQKERLAVIVHSLRELAGKLKQFVAGADGIENMYRGQAVTTKDVADQTLVDQDLAGQVELWIRNGDYANLARLWGWGVDFGWHKLYRKGQPSRISLPTYPFARERYWVGADEPVSGPERDPGRRIVAGGEARSETGQADVTVGSGVDRARIQEIIIRELCHSLKVEAGEVDADAPFTDYGVDSINAVQVVEAVNRILTLDLDARILLDYDSVNGLTGHISSLMEESARNPC